MKTYQANLEKAPPDKLRAGQPEVVVITGASAGVGRATAQAFAHQGAHIGLLARGHDGLEDEPVAPDREDNLWQPVPGDHGAHGSFDVRAKASSPQLWINMNRKWLGLGSSALAGLMIGFLFKRGDKIGRNRE